VIPIAKVIQKHDECIGCGACVAIDPDNWRLNGDKAILIDAKIEGNVQSKEVKDAQKSKEAASACPVGCIIVEE
jgi:ferredoxin